MRKFFYMIFAAALVFGGLGIYACIVMNGPVALGLGGLFVGIALGANTAKRHINGLLQESENLRSDTIKRQLKCRETKLESASKEVLREQQRVGTELQRRWDTLVQQLDSPLAFILGVFNFRKVTSKPSLVRPPGSRVYAVLDFVYSRKTMERVFAPGLADMRDEYFAALAACRPWKARWVVLAYYWSVVKMIPLHAIVALGKEAFEIWKWFGTAG